MNLKKNDDGKKVTIAADYKSIELESTVGTIGSGWSKTTFNFDRASISNGLIFLDQSQILTISSDFWLFSPEDSQSNVSTDDTAKQNTNLLANKPLEADKSSYLRIKILLVFWLLSIIVILGYLIYFVYLLIEKMN